MHQLFGGLNIIAAALLAFLTLLFLGGMRVRDLGVPGIEPVPLLLYGGIAFLLIIGFVWVKWGLVPRAIRFGSWGKLLLGHALILIGTVLYGSVTFYSPVLAWLGIIQWEATAVLPWLALFTLPLACVLWPSGLALVLASRDRGESASGIAATIRRERAAARRR